MWASVFDGFKCVFNTLRSLATRLVRRVRAIELATWKDFAGTAQSIVTIFALAIGGYWTYRTFFQFRQDRPKLNIIHSVERFRIPGNYLLIVKERLSNVGLVAIRLNKGEIRIVQVLPLPDPVARMVNTPDSLKETAEDPEIWTVLRVYEHPWNKKHELIEPGEVDEIQNYFLIPDSIAVVDILSFVGNPAEDSKLAWRALTTYDLRPECNTALTKPAETPPQTK